MFEAHLALPVILDLEVEHRERAVLAGAAGPADLFDHTDRGIGVARVDDDRRRALDLWVFTQEQGDRVTRAVVIVVIVRLVVFGKKVVIEKDRVVGRPAQKRAGLFNRFGDIDGVSRKTLLKPAMPTTIVIEQKNADRQTVNLDFGEAESDQQISKVTHKTNAF